MAEILKKLFSGKSTSFLSGVQHFMESTPSLPQDCNEIVMTGLYDSMKEVLAVPNFLTRSYDQVQVLLHLLQHLALYDQHQDGLHSLLDHGLTNMIILVTSLHLTRGRAGDAVDKFFEDIMETIVAVGDYSTRAKVAMTENFCNRLLQIISSESFRFATRMEALKSINLLLERCPMMVRDRLKEQSYHVELLRNMGRLIEMVGDYEFQVGIVECLFRLVGKSHREDLGENMFSTRQHLRAFLEIRDTEFETDCRAFLNKINSEPKKSNSVHSYPCLSVHLGSFQLQKPEDETYSSFWVDFNTGSNRITLFCNQENPDLQEEGESMWETVSIWKENVVHYVIQESADIVQVNLRLKGPAQDLVTFGPSTNDQIVMILFDARFNLPPALKQTFGFEKCRSASKKKISQVQDPIAIKVDDDECELETVLETDQRSPSNGNRSKLDQSLGPSDKNVDNQTPRMKVSVPREPMRTPTYMCTPTPPSPVSLEQILADVPELETGYTDSPKTPKTTKAPVKRVKTPLNIVGGTEKKDSSKDNTGKVPARRSSRQKASHVSAIVLPSLDDVEEPESAEKTEKHTFLAVTPDDTVTYPAKASQAVHHSEQQEIIPSSCPEECMNIPESQPLSLYAPVLSNMSKGETLVNGVRSPANVVEAEKLSVKSSDFKSQDKARRLKDIKNMKTKILNTDSEYTPTPDNTHKVSHTPCLSTVDEDIMSNHSAPLRKTAARHTPMTMENAVYTIQSSAVEDDLDHAAISSSKPVQMSPDSTSQNLKNDRKKCNGMRTKPICKKRKGKKTEKRTLPESCSKRVTRSCGIQPPTTNYEHPESQSNVGTKPKKISKNMQTAARKENRKPKGTRLKTEPMNNNSKNQDAECNPSINNYNTQETGCKDCGNLIQDKGTPSLPLDCANIAKSNELLTSTAATRKGVSKQQTKMKKTQCQDSVFYQVTEAEVDDCQEDCYHPERKLTERHITSQCSNDKVKRRKIKTAATSSNSQDMVSVVNQEHEIVKGAEIPVDTNQDLEVPSSLSSQTSDITCGQIPHACDTQDKVKQTRRLRTRPANCSPLSGMEFSPTTNAKDEDINIKGETSPNVLEEMPESDNSQKVCKKKDARKVSNKKHTNPNGTNMLGIRSKNKPCGKVQKKMKSFPRKNGNTLGDNHYGKRKTKRRPTEKETQVIEIESAVRLVSPNYRIDSPIKNGHDPYHFEDRKTKSDQIAQKRYKLNAAVVEENDPFGFDSNSPLPQLPLQKIATETDHQSSQNSSDFENNKSQTKFFRHRDMERDKRRLQATAVDQHMVLQQRNPKLLENSGALAKAKSSHRKENLSMDLHSLVSDKSLSVIASDKSNNQDNKLDKSKRGKGQKQVEKKVKKSEKCNLNIMRDRQKNAHMTEKEKVIRDNVLIETYDSNENGRQVSEDEAAYADVSTNTLDEEESDNSTATSAIMNFTAACQGILHKASVRADEESSASKVISNQQKKARIDPDVAEPKQTKNKGRRKKRKNIFSETDDNLSVSGKSEVSWLGSTARKKKTKPIYSYQVQARQIGRKPKLISKGERSEDSESDAGMIEYKPKNNRRSRKGRSRNEGASGDFGTKSHSTGIMHDTCHDKKRNTSNNKVVATKVAKNPASHKPVGSPDQRKSRKRKALRDIGNVTTTPGQGDSIEIPRFEECLHPTPYLIVDSPAGWVSKPQSPSASVDEPLEMGDLDDRMLEIISQCSNFTHISSLKTPKTPATKFDDVDEQLQDSPEVAVKRRNFDQEGSGLKSGPTKRRKLQERRESEDEMSHDDEQSLSCHTQDTPKLYDININISPIPSPLLENSQLRPRQLFPTETPQLATRLDEAGAPSEYDSEDDSVVSEVDPPPRSKKTSSLDHSLNDGVSSLLQSFSSDIKRNMHSKKEQLDHLTRSTLKSSVRQIAEVWNKQKGKREKVYSSYKATISQELVGLEKDVTCLKEAEEKVYAFFLQQMRLMQASRKSQEVRLSRLHQVEVAFSREIKKLEEQDVQNQSFVHGVLKTTINALQKKLLQQTQQEEMCNVKRTLQNLFV